MTRPRSLIRRLERWLVGLAMAVIALILEKIVMRSVRRGETEAPPEPEPTSTTFTSRGSEVGTG